MFAHCTANLLGPLRLFCLSERSEESFDMMNRMRSYYVYMMTNPSRSVLLKGWTRAKKEALIDRQNPNREDRSASLKMTWAKT